jgi:hypothetical protein
LDYPVSESGSHLDPALGIRIDSELHRHGERRDLDRRVGYWGERTPRCERELLVFFRAMKYVKFVRVRLRFYVRYLARRHLIVNGVAHYWIVNDGHFHTFRQLPI